MPNTLRNIFHFRPLTLCLLAFFFFAYSSAQNQAQHPTIPTSHEPGIALGLSLAGFSVPVLSSLAISTLTPDKSNANLAGNLAVEGLWLGPSLGQFYAQKPLHALAGLGARAVGAVWFLSGIAYG